MANGNTKDRPSKRLRERARVAYQAEAIFTPERLLATGNADGSLELAPGRTPADLLAAGIAAGSQSERNRAREERRRGGRVRGAQVKAAGEDLRVLAESAAEKIRAAEPRIRLQDLADRVGVDRKTLMLRDRKSRRRQVR